MSDYISEDNILQILKYLPVKSLIQFRCVCKLWKEIIDSHSFMLDHLFVQKPRFIAEYNDEADFLVFDPHALPSVDTLMCPWTGSAANRFVIFGTLHGVVCLYDYFHLLIWNPSISKFSTLWLPTSIDFDWIGEESQTCSAFWIDPYTKEFKVLIFRMWIGAELGDIEVDADGIFYSSISNDWRVLPLGVLQNWKTCQQSPPLMIDGIAYWSGGFKFVNQQGRRDMSKAILFFDFVHEYHGFIGLPNSKSSASIHPIPCKWKGKLSLVCWDKKFPYRCEMYVVQEGSWVSVFCFNLISPISRVYWVLTSDEMEERLWVLGKFRHAAHKELVLYDTRFGCVPFVGRLWYAYVAYDFVESLLFPKVVDPKRWVNGQDTT